MSKEKHAIKINDKAFVEGRNAYIRRDENSYADNPYPEGTKEHHDWDHGVAVERDAGN